MTEKILEIIKAIAGIFDKSSSSWNSKEAESNARKISTDSIVNMYGSEWKVPVRLSFPVTRTPVIVTDPFGERPLMGKIRFHYGTDFKTVDVRRVVAVEDGVIKKVLDYDKEYPARFKWDGKKWVDAKVPKGRAWTPYIVLVGKYTKNRYVYRHVTPKAGIAEGKEVLCGDEIATTGNYGFSFGEHLHFEYCDWLEDKQTWDKPSDPMVFFRKMGLDVKNKVKIEVAHGQLMELVT